MSVLAVAQESVPEEEARTLPTLLIKGEVVSLDAEHAEAPLVTVKDRYGFETPIFLTGKTLFYQGDAETSQDGLQTGAEVEVEYNFDINTAKRYAVVVRMPAAEGAVAPAAELSTPSAAASAPEPPAEAPAAEATMTEPPVTTEAPAAAMGEEGASAP
jgi:hypothetical protein